MLTSHLACSTWMPKLCAKLSSSCLKTLHCSGNSQVPRRILLSFQFGMFWSLIFIDLRAGLLVTQRGFKENLVTIQCLAGPGQKFDAEFLAALLLSLAAGKCCLKTSLFFAAPGLRAVRKIQRPMTKPRAPLPPEMAMIPSWHNGRETT